MGLMNFIRKNNGLNEPHTYLNNGVHDSSACLDNGLHKFNNSNGFHTVIYLRPLLSYTAAPCNAMRCIISSQQVQCIVV